MWLIVGLGNPGKEYSRTRHNLGARVVRALREPLRYPAFRLSRDLLAWVSKGTHVLAIPTTFMNESGRATQLLLKKHRIPLDHLLLVHDDKDLAFGQLKLQRARNAAGHRGVQSVIDSLGTNDFYRLRAGIGAPPAGLETEDYVLQPFTSVEEPYLTEHLLPRVFQSIKSLEDQAGVIPSRRGELLTEEDKSTYHQR